MLSVHLCSVVAPGGVEPTLQSLVESDFKSDAFCLFRHGAIYLIQVIVPLSTTYRVLLLKPDIFSISYYLKKFKMRITG